MKIVISFLCMAQSQRSLFGGGSLRIYTIPVDERERDTYSR
jgi:hypothetical protein